MPLSDREVHDYLASLEPFAGAPEAAIAGLARAAREMTTDSGGVILELGSRCEHLYVVRTGLVEIRSATGKIFGRLGPGRLFGLRAMRREAGSSYRAVATEPATLITVHRSAVLPVLDAHPALSRALESTSAGAIFEPMLAPPSGPADPSPDMMTTTARDLMTSGPISVDPGMSVGDAARLMRKHDISCLPVVAGGRLSGILTDGDLRDRVLAEGRETTIPVSEIMSRNPIALEPDALAFDALVLMMQHSISHLPIVEKGVLTGILTHTNLVRAQSRSAVYMIGDIHRQTSPARMAEIVRGIPQLLVTLVGSGATAFKIGRIITSICDACTVRLLMLAEERLGPPPVPYLWLACGSQGREEQTGISDQDNCMFLDDSYDEAKHGQYFTDLARFVCDGLNECGYVYCPGEMMAITPRWRQPLTVWRGYFRSWIERPEPMAQMLASVMFDLRPIWGARHLHEGVQSETLARARQNSIFIAHMLSNSLNHRPPLGLFGSITTPRMGEHRNKVDMKHAGVVPIVDIARLYALTAGIGDVNTHRRLEAGRAASVLSDSGARDLLAAFEFIALTRLRHQAQQIRGGRKPDNFMALEEISHLERNQLKDAFSVVKTIQQAMSNAHQIGAR